MVRYPWNERSLTLNSFGDKCHDDERDDDGGITTTTFHQMDGCIGRIIGLEEGRLSSTIVMLCEKNGLVSCCHRRRIKATLTSIDA